MKTGPLRSLNTILILASFTAPGLSRAGSEADLPLRSYFDLSPREEMTQEQIRTKAFVPDLTTQVVDPDYLLSRDRFQSTSDSPQALRGRNKDGSISASQAEYNAILAEELEITRLHDQLRTDHVSLEDFHQNIAFPLEHHQALNEEYLGDWELRTSAFIQRRTALTARKQNYFIPLLHESLHQESARLSAKKKGLSRSQRKRLARLDVYFKAWQGAKHIIGEGVLPRDQNKRMYAIDDYFKRARKLMISLGKADPLPNVSNPNSSVRKEGRNGTLKKGASLLCSVIWRNTTGCCSCAEPEENSTPFTAPDGVTPLFQKLATWYGYHIKVEGRENLANLPLNGDPNRKVVNLFLPAHRNAVRDAMAMTQIGLPHFLLFANPAAFMPTNFLAKMLASLGEFISVGSITGFTPIKAPKKALKALNAHLSSNVLNYPHGLVANMGEILPITPTFVSTLLKPLLDDGFEVNIIPIAYETDSRALAYTGEVDDRNITVKILKPLMHAAVRVLVEKQLKDTSGTKNLYFDHFLNTAWYDSIVRHKELTLDELMDRAEYNLGVSFSHLENGKRVQNTYPDHTATNEVPMPVFQDEDEIAMPVFHE